MNEPGTAEQQKGRKFWHQWVRNYSLGDLAIMGGVAAIGRLLLLNYSRSMVVHSGESLSWALLLLAGITEGALIGFIERKSIRKLVDLKAGVWMTATIAATLIGWFFILAPAIVYISLLARFGEISRTYFVIYIGVAGLAFGTVVGVPQFLILARSFKNAVVWVFANAAAWMLSFIIIYSAITLFDGSEVTNTLLTLLACMISGLVQGAITGRCLHFAMPVRELPPGAN